MSDRQGVEIDYCPQCRGVWLDRGELDKIIERTNQDVPRRPQYEDAPRVSYERKSHDEHGYYDKNSYQKKHKRGSFLGDLFDFGD
jgi:Zn-finger nucleic acid-binding protein